MLECHIDRCPAVSSECAAKRTINVRGRVQTIVPSSKRLDLIQQSTEEAELICMVQRVMFPLGQQNMHWELSVCSVSRRGDYCPVRC